MKQEEYKRIKDAKNERYIAEQNAMKAKMKELKAVHKAEMAKLVKDLEPEKRVNHLGCTRREAHNVCRFINNRLVKEFRWDEKEYIVPTEEMGIPMGFVIEDDKVIFNFTIMRVKHDNTNEM